MRHDISKPMMAKRKDDVSRNSHGLDDAIKKHKENEVPKYPLKINHKTIIFVVKDKCNEQYAQWYRENRMRIRKDEIGCI